MKGVEGYFIWDRVSLEHAWWIFMYRLKDAHREEDTYSGIGRVRAHMVVIHVQVVRCTAGGGYILWERFCQRTHGGYPCTGGRGYILRERLGQSTHGGYPKAVNREDKRSRR